MEILIVNMKRSLFVTLNQVLNLFQDLSISGSGLLDSEINSE